MASYREAPDSDPETSFSAALILFLVFLVIVLPCICLNSLRDK